MTVWGLPPTGGSIDVLKGHVIWQHFPKMSCVNARRIYLSSGSVCFSKAYIYILWFLSGVYINPSRVRVLFCLCASKVIVIPHYTAVSPLLWLVEQCSSRFSVCITPLVCVDIVSWSCKGYLIDLLLYYYITTINTVFRSLAPFTWQQVFADLIINLLKSFWPCVHSAKNLSTAC